MSARRVLVVDDEAGACEFIARALALAGYEVFTAPTGEAGLEVLETQTGIECLVVDKLLPGMHGGEVIERARAQVPRLAVVLVTGHPEPLSFGAQRPDVTLSKPFKTLQELQDAVAQALASAGPVVETLKERLSQVVAEMAPLRRRRE